MFWKNFFKWFAICGVSSFLASLVAFSIALLFITLFIPKTAHPAVVQGLDTLTEWEYWEFPQKSGAQPCSLYYDGAAIQIRQMWAIIDNDNPYWAKKIPRQYPYTTDFTTVNNYHSNIAKISPIVDLTKCYVIQCGYGPLEGPYWYTVQILKEIAIIGPTPDKIVIFWQCQTNSTLNFPVVVNPIARTYQQTSWGSLKRNK